MARLMALLLMGALACVSEGRRQRKYILTASAPETMTTKHGDMLTADGSEMTAMMEELPADLQKVVLPVWTKLPGIPEWMSLGLVLIPVGITLFLIFVVSFLLVMLRTTGVKKVAEPAGAGPEGEGVEVVPPPMELLQRIMGIAVPTAIGNMLFMVNEVVNMVMLGHVGTTDQIAAVGLGNTMQNCFGLVIGLGLVTGLDPLCSQATGAGNEKMAATYLQRCRCVVSLQCIWMLPFLFFSEPLLVMIGQNPEVAANAGHYNKISCLGLFQFFNMFAAMSWLRARGENGIPVLIWACVVCLHVPSCFLWVVVLGLGNAGCGMANLISWTLGFVSLHWYLAKVARDAKVPLKSVLWIEADGLKGWFDFCKIAVPACLQSCTEMWYFELVTFVTGYLGSLQLASWVSAYTVYGMLNMPSLGISTGASVVVGFAIGEKKPQTAKALIITSIIMVYALGMVLAALLIGFRYPVCWIFNDNPDIHAVMSNILILMAITGVSDYAQTTVAGILRGLFKPSIVVVGFILSFWCISLPLGLWLGFPMKIGVYGLGFANCIGSSVAAVFFGVTLMFTDVDYIAKQMTERLEQEKTSMQPVTVLVRGRNPSCSSLVSL